MFHCMMEATAPAVTASTRTATTMVVMMAAVSRGQVTRGRMLAGVNPQGNIDIQTQQSRHTTLIVVLQRQQVQALKAAVATLVEVVAVAAS